MRKNSFYRRKPVLSRNRNFRSRQARGDRMRLDADTTRFSVVFKILSHLFLAE